MSEYTFLSNLKMQDLNEVLRDCVDCSKDLPGYSEMKQYLLSTEDNSVCINITQFTTDTSEVKKEVSITTKSGSFFNFNHDPDENTFCKYQELPDFDESVEFFDFTGFQYPDEFEKNTGITEEEFNKICLLVQDLKDNYK